MFGWMNEWWLMTNKQVLFEIIVVDKIDNACNQCPKIELTE